MHLACPRTLKPALAGAAGSAQRAHFPPNIAAPSLPPEMNLACPHTLKVVRSQGRLSELVGEVQAQRREEAEMLAVLEPLRERHAALLAAM